MSPLWHFKDMATSSQVYQNKRRRDEYWNDGFALPNKKQASVHDSAGMSLLENIDNMDNNNSNPEETDVGINIVINSLEDEIQLKAHTDHNIESTDEMGSINEGLLAADLSNEATSVTLDIWELMYYDYVGAEIGLLVDFITPQELGIIINSMHGDSMPHIMYSDALYGYAESPEVFTESLWHFNEHPVIQDHLESPWPEESGITGEVQFHDVWN